MSNDLWPEKLTRRYTKKPEDIEAVKLTKANQKEVMAWCGSTEWRFKPMDTDPIGIVLPNQLLVRYGHYLLRDGSGEFSPLRPDVFERDYVEGVWNE